MDAFEEDKAMRETPNTVTPDPEVVTVDTLRVSCGGGALGHPRVWYSLDDGEAECGCCDRKFIYKGDGH